MYNNTFLPHRIIFLLLLAAVICGCTQRAVLYPDSPTGKVLSAISSVVTENDVLSAIAQIDLITPQGYHQARAALIMKKPAYLRLELIPVIGTPDLILSSSPKEMRILIPSKGEFYHGRPSGANLALFLPWQFNIEDIVPIFIGAYPPFDGEVIHYQSYPEKKSLRIEMKARTNESQILWIGGNNRLLNLVRLDENGKEIYNVKYEDYEQKSPVPGKITINMADGVTSISLKYSDLKIEKTTDLSIFDLPVPTGVKSILLD